MTGKQVWRLLRENHGINVGYSTIKRYLRSEFAFGRTKATVRIETPPGLEAQADFGFAGLMLDPETKRRRKTWAFIMTLSSSRHKFVRFVFHQDIDMWLDCHERAFAFFGGVPRRIILDNLKSGILKPDIYDPTINRAYADMERFFGFVADPAKVGMAQHKDYASYCTSFVVFDVHFGRSLKRLPGCTFGNGPMIGLKSSSPLSFAFRA